MIKIEFPADRKDIALAIGKALTEIGQGAVVPAAAVDSFSKVAEPEGPFYWLHHESESYGIAATWDELEGLQQSDPLVEAVSKDAYGKWVAEWSKQEDAGKQAAQEAPNADSTSQAATQEQKAAGAHVAGDATKVDEKGVPFNAEFCGKAAIPFYGSGKKKGQWKKRQGVDEDAYDEWYAGELFSDQAVTHEEDLPEETTSDSNIAGSVFAVSDNQQNAAAGEDVPQDAGQLMKWVSEQQAAGNITQQQVTDAYTALQLPFDAVMNPAYPVADNCAAIYNHLKGQIG